MLPRTCSWSNLIRSLSWTRRALSTTRDVPLTSRVHSDLRRGDYGHLEDSDLNVFTGIVGKDGIVTDPDQLTTYNTDWVRTLRGDAKVVLRPLCTREVSAILNHCSQRRLAVVPQGGNTSLSGGSVPVFDEVILSMSRMNRIVDLDPDSGVVECEAGCVLEALDKYVSKHGLIVPLDLGAKGSCQIGGNVATNAGGLRLLRYGSLHDSVLGLEVVLSDGSVLDAMIKLRKNNTGYDVKQLFIGSEGTLGIVTRVAVLCPPRSPSVHVALFACDSFEKVLRAFTTARSTLGEIVSSCEFFDAGSLDLVRKHLGLESPIAPDAPFYFLLETSGSDETHDAEKLGRLCDQLSDQVIDGTIAEDGTKMAAIWALRERITEALVRNGYSYKYDVSVPISHFYRLVEDMRRHLSESAASAVVGYGHLGDGNLHFNVTSPQYDPDLARRIEPKIYELVSALRGSISAEHGLGFKKRNYIYFSRSVEAVRLMKSTKKSLDPRHILNPYKLFPDVIK